jgi:glyoxylate/hydroxypyruvate reductase A
MTIGVYLQDGSAKDWVSALADQMPNEFVADVADIANPADVEILVVGNPTASELSQYTSVRFVQSTYAGPDRYSSDPDRPAVPAARIVGGGLAIAMAEFVTAAVTSAHRQFPAYRDQQSERDWNALDQPLAADRTIGFLGNGPLAQASARMVAGLGFQVMAWARSQRSGDIPVVAGADGFSDLLHKSTVVVNLLPLTPETTGLLDVVAFEQFRSGAALVHCGRGPQVKTLDLIASLDSGQISHAWLDVFAIEPLASDDPLWTHPSVTITPHIAASSSPHLLAADIAKNISRFRSHRELKGLI